MSTTTGGTVATPQMDSDWAFLKAHFPSESKKRSIPDRPIALIDVGDGNGGLSHPLLLGRVTRADRSQWARGVQGTLLRGTHVAEVAGVIAERCSADMIFYDVGTTAGWDDELFKLALEAILRSNPKPAVINISVGWPEEVPGATALLDQCLAEGISVVVAMGDDGALTDIDWYPATHPGVIAVAGTDRHDLPLSDSDHGDHVWIAAPGEDILTVVAKDDLGTRNGTSFAAAQVSAAVWLAIQANPTLDTGRIRQLLGESADSALVGRCPPKMLPKVPSNGNWNPAVGCGRLDVKKFLDAVDDDGLSEPARIVAGKPKPGPMDGVTGYAAMPKPPESQPPLL